MVILHWKRERERWLSFTGKKQRERDGHPSLKKNREREQRERDGHPSLEKTERERDGHPSLKKHTERDDQPLHEVVSDVVRGRCVRIGG